MILQSKVRNIFFHSFSTSALVESNKLYSDFGCFRLYLIFKKKILNFIGPRSSNAFNVSHQKELIFLTHLCVGPSHLREHKFKRRFLGTLNPICICCFDIETLNHFFLHCPRFTNERKNHMLKIESIISDIFRKNDISIT